MVIKYLSNFTISYVAIVHTYKTCIPWHILKKIYTADKSMGDKSVVSKGLLDCSQVTCCYMIATIIQHNAIVITEPYSVVIPEPSTSFGQSSDCSRGLLTLIGWLTSTIAPS